MSWGLDSGYTDSVPPSPGSEEVSSYPLASTRKRNPLRLKVKQPIEAADPSPYSTVTMPNFIDTAHPVFPTLFPQIMMSPPPQAMHSSIAGSESPPVSSPVGKRRRMSSAGDDCWLTAGCLPVENNESPPFAAFAENSFSQLSQWTPSLEAPHPASPRTPTGSTVTAWPSLAADACTATTTTTATSANSIEEEEVTWAMRRLQAMKFRSSTTGGMYGADTLSHPPYVYEMAAATSSGAGPQNSGSATPGQPVSIFDMVELIVTCPTFSNFLGCEFERQLEGNADEYQIVLARQHLLEPYLRFHRRIGVHAGITLYNLHRVLCYCLNYDEELAEDPLHIWTVPNAQSLYANGHVFREEARKFKLLMTDKTVALSEFIPAEGWSGFQFEYCLGDLHFTIVVNDLLKGQTAQQDLLWVPRLCEGSYGYAPPQFLVSHKRYAKILQQYAYPGSQTIASINQRLGIFSEDTDDEDPPLDSVQDEQLITLAIEQHLWGDLVQDARSHPVFDIDAVNRILSETRFGRNLAVSRKSKRTRIIALKEESTRLVQFRLPVRAFFGEPISKATIECFMEKPRRKRRVKTSPSTPNPLSPPILADAGLELAT